MVYSGECYFKHHDRCENEDGLCKCSCHVNKENPYWLTLHERG